MSDTASIRKQHRQGAFKRAFQLMFESYGVIWQCKGLFFKIAVMLMGMSVVIQFLSVALDPEYTMEDWYHANGGNAVHIFSGALEQASEDAAEEHAGGEAEAEEELSLEGKYGIKEAKVSPISMSIQMLGFIAMWLIQYVIALFVYSQFLVHAHKPSLGELKGAVQSCPWSFYKALLYKWLYPLVYFAPAVLMGGIGAAMGSAALGGLAVFVGLAGIVAVLVWFMRMLFLEHLVLFRGMSIKEARETSKYLMIGRKRRYFGAALCAGIILAMIIGMGAGLMAMVFMAIAIGLAFVSPMAAIAVVVVMVLLMILLYTIPQLAATGWIYMLYHEWSTELDEDVTV